MENFAIFEYGAGSIIDSIKTCIESPSKLFNVSLLLLGFTTVVFKGFQWTSTTTSPKIPIEDSGKFTNLRIRFVAVFWLLRCADWLQGPYFYEVYSSKVFNGVAASFALISKLFLTGFASTAIFGPFVGRALDTYGRKRGTLAFTIFYGLGAISTKSTRLPLLFLGRTMSGIGTSLLFSAPESWLVGETQLRGNDPSGKWLADTFGMVRSHVFRIAFEHGQNAYMAL